MGKWLVKSDPETYSWDNFVADRKTDWDGVRSYEARNNLALMQEGDEVLFYHSNTDKAVLGIAVVSKSSFPDTTTDNPAWLAVELEAKCLFEQPVELKHIKTLENLQNIALVRQSRLSVMPLNEDEFQTIVKLGKDCK